MNKRGSDGRGSCIVYGVANMAEFTNVVVTDTGNGGDWIKCVESKKTENQLCSDNVE